MKVLKKLPNENEVQYTLRCKKYEQAIKCDCKRCKEIIENYNSDPNAFDEPLTKKQKV